MRLGLTVIHDPWLLISKIRTGIFLLPHLTTQAGSLRYHTRTLGFRGML